MKRILITIAAYVAMESGIFIADFGHDYFNHFIDKKVNERIDLMKTQGTPAYCSFKQ